MQTLDDVLTLIRAGEYNRALDGFTPLIENGDDEEIRRAALGHRAWLNRSQGRWEEALVDYKQLSELDKDNAEILCLAAECSQILQRSDEAKEFAAAAIVINPLHRRALSLLAILTQQDKGGSEEPANPFATPGFTLNFALHLMENAPATFPSSISPWIARLIYSHVRLTRPKVVIEIGSNFGFSTLWFAQALKDNGEGHLEAFDLFVDNPDYLSPIIGQPSSGLEVVRRHLEVGGLTNWATLHQGDSSTSVSDLFEQTGKKIDFAFIDGDHNITGMLKDWHAVDKNMAEGGYILLHDIDPEKCHWLGPRYLLDKMHEQNIHNYQALEIPTPEGFGIAILQKKNKDKAPFKLPGLLHLLKERLFVGARFAKLNNQQQG